MNKPDALGDVLKKFELAEAGRACMKGLPIVARLDGRAFHTFTADLEKPYDARMSLSMCNTAEFLLKETNADLAYTQSDEITLFWKNEYTEADTGLFGGRYQKLTSVLSGLASVAFFKEVLKNMPDKSNEVPVFDCRVFQLPTASLVADCFKWRELDATKNAVSMAAHAYFPHTRLHGMSGREKQELLFAEKGINFNDYPAFFKRGVYVRRVKKLTELSEDVRAKIPEKHRPAVGTLVERSMIDVPAWEKCTTITNWTDVVYGADPIYGSVVTA